MGYLGHDYSPRLKRKRSLLSRKGFTLIELMIVVAILAILAAIAIPSLISARKSGNEAAAIGTLRTLATCCEQYRTLYGEYPPTLNDLRGDNLDYIDEVLAAGEKHSYDFDITGGNNTYTCTGSPETESDGDRAFFVDESGVIRWTTGMGPATAVDPPIE